MLGFLWLNCFLFFLLPVPSFVLAFLMMHFKTENSSVFLKWSSPQIPKDVADLVKCAECLFRTQVRVCVCGEEKPLIDAVWRWCWRVCSLWGGESTAFNHIPNNNQSCCVHYKWRTHGVHKLYTMYINCVKWKLKCSKWTHPRWHSLALMASLFPQSQVLKITIITVYVKEKWVWSVGIGPIYSLSAVFTLSYLLFQQIWAAEYLSHDVFRVEPIPQFIAKQIWLILRDLNGCNSTCFIWEFEVQHWDQNKVHIFIMLYTHAFVDLELQKDLHNWCRSYLH